jgi:hypothetical protein
MNRLLISVGVTAAIAACGKGGGSDWTSKPAKTIAATVRGVAFTIEAPEGMRQQAKPDELQLDFLIDDYVKTPDITVRASGYAKTLDDYVKSEKEVTNWVRRDALPDGYVVSYENPNYKGKEDYLVYVHRTFGDKVLTCEGRLTPWERGATSKDKLPALEKVCLSIKRTN